MTECGCTVWPWMLMACSRRLAVPFPFIQPSFVHYQPNFLYAQSFIFIVRQACFECPVMTSIWPSKEGNPGKKDNIWGKNNSIYCVCPPLCSSSGGLVVNICGNTCTLPRLWVEDANCIFMEVGKKLLYLLRASVMVPELEGSWNEAPPAQGP